MVQSIIVGVMGPGKGATESNKLSAYELGQRIAQHNWVLLTGGRKQGVMHAALRGAKSSNGTTIGILPGETQEGMSDFVDIPILTGLGEARNIINILTSHIIIACGIGPGTSSEISFAIKKQKPVILLDTNSTTEQYFTNLSERILIAATAVDAVTMVREWLQ